MLQRVSFPVQGTEVIGVLHLPDGGTVGGVIAMGGGDIEHGAYIREALASAGIAALGFAFRVPRDTPAGLTDAAAAIRLLRAHPAVPQRIGIVGHSQGGLVAAMAAGRDSRVRAAAILAAPAERDYTGNLRPIAELSRTRARVLLVYGGADELVAPEDAERYASVLRQAGVVHRVVTIDGADHQFAAPAHRARMLEALTDWMRSALAG